MQKALFTTPIFFCLFYCCAFGQATDPAPFDLSGGAVFTFDTYTGSSFPANISVGTQNNGTAGNFTSAINTDATYGPGNTLWQDEGTDGISYKGGGAGERGCFTMFLNTTDRMNVKVQWAVREITVGNMINSIELQYRIGSSGGFTNVNNDLYVTGTTPSGTTFSKTLPAATDNQPVLYLRWIYYETTGAAPRYRLAIDDITVSSVVLPIELSRFEAQAKGNTVNLDWETQTETNNARFLIERSANGTDFRTLESMAGAGNSYAPHSYHFIDPQPLPGISYYRLQQVDFDGYFSFSPVRQVSRNGAGGMRLAPSLAVTDLQVALETAPPQDSRWTIFDASGHLVRSGVWPAETTEMTLEISDLPSGNFLLNVGTATQRFVKQ